MQDSMQNKQDKEDPLVAIKRQEIQLKAEIEKAKLQIASKKNEGEARSRLQTLQLEYEKLKLQEKSIILDARIALAGQEQDSNVTVMQMGMSEIQSRRKDGNNNNA
jgi:hypothetical protein